MAHFLGPCLVSWETKKQLSVALSTAEAEYIAAASCCAQLLWIRQQLKDFCVDIWCIPIYCDNTSAINIAKNPCQHKRTKHIDIRHHFLRDNVEKGVISMNFYATENQIADIFTKALSREQFERNRLELGLIKTTWSSSSLSLLAKFKSYGFNMLQFLFVISFCAMFSICEVCNLLTLVEV